MLSNEASEVRSKYLLTDIWDKIIKHIEEDSSSLEENTFQTEIFLTRMCPYPIIKDYL